LDRIAGVTDPTVMRPLQAIREVFQIMELLTLSIVQYRKIDPKLPLIDLQQTAGVTMYFINQLTELFRYHKAVPCLKEAHQYMTERLLNCL